MNYNLNVNQSAITLHLAENADHVPNNNSLVLIEEEPRKFFRKVKKSLYIRTLIPLLKPI
jgi:hypothetical protein